MRYHKCANDIKIGGTVDIEVGYLGHHLIITLAGKLGRAK